jgi:hypothetical protein
MSASQIDQWATWFARWAFVCLFWITASAAVPAALAQRRVEPGSAADRPAPGSTGQMNLQEVPAKPGEICAVCNEPVGAGDTAYLMAGQRVPVHRGACDAKFHEGPQLILAKLQPRGAFLGTSPQERALSRVWFLLGLYVLVGLIFAALCAHRALHAGHSPAAWFAAGLILSVFAYLALLTRSKRAVSAPGGVPRGLHKVAATYSPEPCPACGHLNHPSARRCLGCGGMLAPKISSEAGKAIARTS